MAVVACGGGDAGGGDNGDNGDAGDGDTATAAHQDGGDSGRLHRGIVSPARVRVGGVQCRRRRGGRHGAS